jgi:hypothetical protein
MIVHKNEGPFKKKINKIPHLMGECISLSFNFQCIWHSMHSKFKCNCGDPFIFLHITLNVQTIKNEMQIKGLENWCIANEGMQHTLHKGTHK